MPFPAFAASSPRLKIALSSIWSRYALAAVAGLLLAAALPKLSLAGLAWVAPALMLAAAHGKPGGDSFRIGYVAGLAHYLASLYWLLLIPVAWFPILGWISLSAYLALFPATWVWLTSGKIGEGGWGRRICWPVAGAVIWVALEMVQARLLSGFPWNFIGVSQYRLAPLIQIASVTGVYGVSFLVVWFSLALGSAALALVRQPATRHAWMGEIILPLAALVVVFGFGFRQLARPDETRPTLRVTFIQPSIPQKMIWTASEDSSWFRGVLDLAAHALTNQTDLLLWPESAIPGMVRYDEDIYRAVTGLARSNHVWMIIGSTDAEPPRNGSTNSADADYFNASFLVSPQGELVKGYRKRNLVIFGEYIPLVRWLPFVKWFTPITGGFTPGDRAVPFEINRWGERPREPFGETNDATPFGSPGVSPHQTVKASVLICFEDVFPQLVREYADDDTDFLVNLTNDGWFGERAEQWQHAANAVFRAVENGLPLLRCCNNGLTCWIDANGRIRQVFADPNGSVYGKGFMSADIPLLMPGEKRPPTFYNRHGDWFGWTCVATAAFVWVAHLPRPKLRGSH